MAESAHRLRVAVVSTYPPRHCGIAEYTSDLRRALLAVAGGVTVDIVAVDWDDRSYPDEVSVVIDRRVPASYPAAVDALLAAGTDIALIQVEFGREYGLSGEADQHGANLAVFARTATGRGLPYAVTLHTVPSLSTDRHRALMAELCAGAAFVTVFTDTARRALVKLGVVPDDRVTVLRHGAPEPIFAAGGAAPGPVAALAPDVPVLSTFGLLSGAKGIEVALDAVGALKERHPRLRYVIAGRTHPEVLRRYGEAYRDRLREHAHRLDLTGHVIFLDRYLDLGEIAALLRRTTIFLTPYQSADQTSSGALTFALAAGCPVVSTTYQYASEMLATSGAGRLVPRGDGRALADAVAGLLDDPAELARSRVAASELAATLSWRTIAGGLHTRLARAVQHTGVTGSGTVTRTRR